MKLDQLEQLRNFRTVLDPQGLVPQYVEEDEDVVLVESEREALQKQLLAQHEQQQDLPQGVDIFGFGGPQNDEVVTVSYFDGVVEMIVDISFDSLGKNITEEQCLFVRNELRAFAKGASSLERKKHLQNIAALGSPAVEMIFRECRQFDLVEESVRAEVIKVMAQLSYRDLQARLLNKGILQHSTSSSHTLLAIGVAGALRDEEAVGSLVDHLQHEEFFKVALDALLKIRHVPSLEQVIQGLEQLDVSQKHLVDYAITQAPRFKKFGPETVELIFRYYEDGKNRAVRKIYIDAICAYGDDAIPQLLKAIDNAKRLHDLGRLSQICMTLGNLRTPAATTVLTNALQNANEREKRAIIIGLGRAADDSVMDLIVHELMHTDDVVLKSECINALSFFRFKKKEVTDIVTPFLKVKENHLFLDAMSCLIRAGNKKLLDDLVHYALEGTEREQGIAQSLLSRLPFKDLLRVGQRILNLTDDKALQIVMILQRTHKLPYELGAVLVEKLKTPMMPLLEMEIYRLIAKHVNSATPLLPAEVLFEARHKTTNERISRELSTMISKISNRGGVIIADND
ncbi:MAG: HEAT repeat domain-containing protein [Solibacillus sp.]